MITLSSLLQNPLRMTEPRILQEEGLQANLPVYIAGLRPGQWMATLKAAGDGTPVRTPNRRTTRGGKWIYRLRAASLVLGFTTGPIAAEVGLSTRLYPHYQPPPDHTALRTV